MCSVVSDALMSVAVACSQSTERRIVSLLSLVAAKNSHLSNGTQEVGGNMLTHKSLKTTVTQFDYCHCHFLRFGQLVQAQQTMNGMHLRYILSLCDVRSEKQ